MICCKECLDLLIDYLEGELDDQTVTALTDTNSGTLVSGWNLIVLN